jgi:hypothetical protein
MVEGKSHRIDSSEILIIEEVLLTRQPAALATEIGGQRPNHWIEDRDCRHLDTPAAFLQRLTKHIADQGEQNDTPICFDPGDNPINLTARPNHAPDMLNWLRAVKLHKASPGHRMNGFSGGIRNEMEMKTRHKQPSHAGRVIPAALCIIR